VNKEPLWKLVLNWGAIITFLTLPTVILSVQLIHWTHPGFFQFPANPRIEYLREFQRNLTILVFGLAGLRTWEQIKNGKNGNGKHDTKSERTH
jgi:hypothetical protein